MKHMADRAGLQFHSSPTPSLQQNTTGIFISPSHLTVVATDEMSERRLYKDHATDVRVETSEGDQILLQNLSLPSSDYRRQTQIINETDIIWRELKTIHPNLLLFFGGDLNHSMENETNAEKWVRLAIERLSRNSHTEDIKVYDDTISSYSTNQASSCRRIDRLYAPQTWRHRAMEYNVKKPRVIHSTHFLISIRFLLDTSNNIFVGKPRFRYPLQRLRAPFDSYPTSDIPRELSMDAAVKIMRGDGLSYRNFMGHLNTQNMRLADKIRHQEPKKSRAEHIDEANKTFFQQRRFSPTIFKKLTDNDRESSATTTTEMVRLASRYYRSLYAKPIPKLSFGLDYIMSKVTQKLDQDDQSMLNQAFTELELYQALCAAEKGTSPGPDGLPFEVLDHYWDRVGSILTRDANKIMTTGELPRCYQAVDIILIPKNGKSNSVDISDLRPISLSNASIKVISSAICTRLQKVRDKLIGPYQRGFMKDRNISHNTMEFFTMVKQFLAHPHRYQPDCYSAIMMADFTKAFDNISHGYLLKVMHAMGIRGGIHTLLTSILRQQYARVQINNCKGPRFPLNCGTRQGNPLSPLLFNIALEPFLYHMESLQGLEIPYQGLNIHTMKYHAFADDVNLYLRDLKDYKKAAEIIEHFELASNSQLSSAKSKLIGLQPAFVNLHQRILPFEHLYLGSAKMKYLGLSLKGVNWKAFMDNLPFMTHIHGYNHLDLISRALGTNIFICSKTVYKDLVHCMTQREVRNLDHAIKMRFRNIGDEKVYARPKKGGYGLIRLEKQLLGHRAKVILTTLKDTGWYATFLRLKMMHHFTKIDRRNKHVTVDEIEKSSIADFLFDSTDAVFHRLDWTFTPNEIEYINAWRTLVPRSRTYPRTTWRMTREQLLIHASTIPTITSREEQVLSNVPFRSLHRLAQEAEPPIMPGRFTELCPPARVIKRWDVFWKALYKEEWLKRNDFTALHLFNFGSYVPVHDDKNHSEPLTCRLCCEPTRSDQIQKHLYNSCESSKYWWRKLEFPRPMNLEEMLAPADTSFHNLRRLNRFVKVVKATYHSRYKDTRSEHLPLEPLSTRELDQALGRTAPMGR
ncbi:hypothetical protein FDK38_004846 [Candidozyma auris]|nr:hypothetical protein FDK38_004846 [[Candida] auris]